MNPVKTDIINIFLMIFSAILAILLPFELFLLSYAILGPLHYLTEISWLHQKQYFIKNKRDYKVLLLICIFIAIAISIIAAWVFLKNLSITTKIFSLINFDKNEFEIMSSTYLACLVFFAFTSALILTFIHDWWWRINSFVISFILICLFKGTFNYSVIFGILLTTIIHVWVFTGIFILLGAIKNKKLSGYISFLIFLICSFSFCFISKNNYIINQYFLGALAVNNFALNQTLLNILNIPFEKSEILTSVASLKIQSFIAYIYTYHYLNWFSKVDLIKWNKVPKPFLFSAIALWIISVGLYYYDYSLGFYFLIFLSMMHVFLEFPLNFVSIKELFKLVKER